MIGEGNTAILDDAVTWMSDLDAIKLGMVPNKSVSQSCKDNKNPVDFNLKLEKMDLIEAVEDEIDFDRCPGESYFIMPLSYSGSMDL